MRPSVGERASTRSEGPRQTHTLNWEKASPKEFAEALTRPVVGVVVVVVMVVVVVVVLVVVVVI